MLEHTNIDFRRGGFVTHTSPKLDNAMPRRQGVVWKFLIWQPEFICTIPILEHFPNDLNFSGCRNTRVCQFLEAVSYLRMVGLPGIHYHTESGFRATILPTPRPRTPSASRR